MTSNIKMQPVVSSNISAIGHDDITNVMHVQFTTGKVYSYQNVVADTFKQILEAESVGKAFNSLVKKFPLLYPFAQV